MLMFLQGISELGDSVLMATISDVNVTGPYAVIDFRTDVETTLNINDTVLESLFNNAIPDNRRFGVSGAENIVNQEGKEGITTHEHEFSLGIDTIWVFPLILERDGEFLFGTSNPLCAILLPK